MSSSSNHVIPKDEPMDCSDPPASRKRPAADALTSILRRAESGKVSNFHFAKSDLYNSVFIDIQSGRRQRKLLNRRKDLNKLLADKVDKVEPKKPSNRRSLIVLCNSLPLSWLKLLNLS
jgi:hypothetical protein